MALLPSEKFLPSFVQDYNLTDTRYYDGSTYLLMAYIIQQFSFLRGFKPGKLPKRISMEPFNKSLNFEVLTPGHETFKFKVSREADGLAPGLEHGTYVFSYPSSKAPTDINKDFYYSDSIIGFSIVVSGTISFNNQGEWHLLAHVKLDAPGGTNLIDRDIDLSDSVNKEICYEKGLGWLASAKLCLKVQYPCLILHGEVTAFGQNAGFDQQLACF